VDPQAGRGWGAWGRGHRRMICGAEHLEEEEGNG